MKIIIDKIIKRLISINDKDLTLENLIYNLGQAENEIYEERERLIKKLFIQYRKERKNGNGNGNGSGNQAQ